MTLPNKQTQLEERHFFERRIVYLCIILTFLAVIFGTLVWADNRISYRDGGSFADLLSAIFSLISVIWFVAALYLQREELALQRHELCLQREEVRRLADETMRQATLMSDQISIERKASIVKDFRAYLQSEKERLDILIREMREIVNSYACEVLDVNPESISSIKRVYAHDFIKVTVTSEETQQSLEVRIRYVDVVRRISDSPRLWRGYGFWKACRRVGLGRWFRQNLPYLVAAGTGFTPYQIQAFTNLVARMRAKQRG